VRSGLRVLLAGAGAVAALAVVAPPAVEAQPGLDENSVTVVVQDMTPNTAAYTAKPNPLKIALALTNTTDQPLYNVNLGVDRDAPVSQQKQLEQLMAKPAPGPQGGLSPLPPQALQTLNPHETRKVLYETTTSSMVDPKGICLCFESGGGVYPINFTVSAAPDPDAGTVQVGFGQTYLPAFKDTPKPVQVSWVWPLIDRPHRVEEGGAFIDDDLAASIRQGGRLDKALTVVEQVAHQVQLTLVIDPELLDELTAMSRPYSVESGGKVTTGTGTAAARAWLGRLRSVIAAVPSMEISLTAYADPDIDALTRADLSWKANFGAEQQGHVQSALGFLPGRDVAWPPGGTISQAALQQVLSSGDKPSVIVLNDSAMSGASHQIPRPDALASLPVQYGSTGTVAAVTDSAVQTWSDRAFGTSAGVGVVPELTSELAVRAAEQPQRSHYVVITAPRYVDVDPRVARRAMLTTAHASWSTSLTLGEAAKQVRPVDHGQLIESGNEQQVPAATLQRAKAATQFVSSFGSALSNDDAARVIGDLPAAIQRTESAAWRADPGRGADFAQRLKDQIQNLQGGVYIFRPSSGSYTLASNDAPLPITVINTLPVDIRVRVSVMTSNGVTGFESNNERVQVITRAASAHSPSRSTLKIPTHVQRAGTFQVRAVLLAPDGTPLGSSVPLSIHCTALGAVGVIITAVAGGILVLALAFRVFRRIRARSTRSAAEMVPARPAGVNP
jgi:hypothetical protein